MKSKVKTLEKPVFNPYLPSYEYVPDGEPYVFGNRVYVFGSHDKFNGKGFCEGDYVCWSASIDDLSNWRNDGVIYRRNQDPGNQDGKMVMNAPDVQQGVDGRYYLYYQLGMLATCSVAVADSPEGPYEFYGYVRHEDGSLFGGSKGDIFCFDPSVFRDNDGKFYLYVGFSPDRGLLHTIVKLLRRNFDGGFGVELDSDMLTLRGEPVMVVPGSIKAVGTPFAGHGFYEASSMRKVGDRYYFVYSSILSHELCYATSDAPLGSFTYGGTLVSIGDIGYQGRTEADNYTGNTHGGMAEINGQWYIFYHRQTNKQKCARQGCAEKITFLPDGTIPQVEMTSCGLNEGPLPAVGRYEARIACNLGSRDGTFPYLRTHEKDRKGIHPYFTQSGADREKDGDQYIANMTDGAWAGFKYFAFTGNETEICVKVRGKAFGTLKVFTEKKRSPAAEIALSPSVDVERFSASLSVSSGVWPLYFVYEGDRFFDFFCFEIR